MAKVWYLGHSCFSLEMAGMTIVTDPFIRPNPKAKHIDFTSLKADVILVSHGHQDHIADLTDLARQTGALVIACYEIGTWLQKQGYEHVLGMNIGGTAQIDGVHFKMVKADHSSSFADGSYAGVAAGFVIHGAGDTIYFAGDTGLTRDMELIADEYVLDMALLPLGDTFTMGYADAAKAAQLISCSSVVGMHFDTFEPIRIDHKAAKDHFRQLGIDLTLPNVGDIIEL